MSATRPQLHSRLMKNRKSSEHDRDLVNDRDARLAAALRANLKRRKAAPGKPAKPAPAQE